MHINMTAQVARVLESSYSGNQKQKKKKKRIGVQESIGCSQQLSFSFGKKHGESSRKRGEGGELEDLGPAKL